MTAKEQPPKGWVVWGEHELQPGDVMFDYLDQAFVVEKAFAHDGEKYVLVRCVWGVHINAVDAMFASDLCTMTRKELDTMRPIEYAIEGWVTEPRKEHGVPYRHIPGIATPESVARQYRRMATAVAREGFRG